MAVLLCAVLCVGIWCATIWNNFAFRNGLIADDYLLPVSLLALLVVVLGINPLLRRFAPRLAFSRRGLALVCGVLFMAALPPSAGILRQLAFPLPQAVLRANTEEKTAEAYEALGAPQVLFPDSMEYGAELPVIEPFIDELQPGESIPWSEWLGPILGWSGFVLPWFLMMVALAAIMTKYWQDEERVAFPLLTIFRSLIDVPEGVAGRVPAIFRSRGFWIGCGVVFLLHGLSQGQRFMPGTIPAIPLSWRLGPHFTEQPWNLLGGWVKHGQLFFTFIAVAYFLPNRTSFSIWSVQIAAAVYVMVGQAYFPPYKGYTVNDLRVGAFIVFALLVLWLARRHLLHVARCMIGMIGWAGSSRDRAYLVAGWAFAAGCLGMLIWFIWVGVPMIYGIAFVFAAVLAALTLMRVVAETGLPLFFFSTSTFSTWLQLIPLHWRTLPAMYFGGLVSVWLGSGQRLCIGAVAMQALGLERDDDVPRHVRLGGLFMLVLAVALVCGWLLILVMSYAYSETPSGHPVAWWGSRQFRTAETLLLDTYTGVAAKSFATHLPYLLTGGAMALVLFQLCQRFPGWPLHPIGLLGFGTWCVAQIWPNVFLGWAIRNLLIRFGGTRAYLAMRPMFIGMLMGELFALFVWSAIAAVMALNGIEYERVNILPY